MSKTFKSIDDVLAYYGWGGEVEKEDDSKGKDILSGSSKDESNEQKMGNDVLDEL
jgi:hypothetical protein